MRTVSSLRKQLGRRPRRVAAVVARARVQTTRIARPELDRIGHHAVAAPERRPVDGAALEARGRLGDLRVERGARLERVALARRPRTHLTLARPRGEVRVGPLVAHALY